MVFNGRVGRTSGGRNVLFDKFQFVVDNGKLSSGNDPSHNSQTGQHTAHRSLYVE